MDEGRQSKKAKREIEKKYRIPKMQDSDKKKRDGERQSKTKRETERNGSTEIRDGDRRKEKQ